MQFYVYLCTPENIFTLTKTFIHLSQLAVRINKGFLPFRQKISKKIQKTSKKVLTFKSTCAIIILVLARTTVSQVIIRADVAELADALDSGSSGSNTVGVRVPSSARTKPSMKMLGFLLSSDLIPSTTRTTALLPQSRSAAHQQLISKQTLQQQTIYNKKGFPQHTTVVAEILFLLIKISFAALDVKSLL